MPITMYDDINLALIPKDAQAVAGYVNGSWPTYSEVVRRWPKAKHLSISVASYANADCLDVEHGDAPNWVAPGWVRRQMARGIKRPVVYTSLANAQTLLNVLAKAGISRGQIRLWTAHYTQRAHICGPDCTWSGSTAATRLQAPADATQWTSRAFGRSLDESLCGDTFFGVPKPGPLPNPTKPVTVPGWWYRWAEWKLGGSQGARPAYAGPARIPVWAWIMLYNWRIRHPR